MFTIEDLREGKCAVKNDGTLRELRKVLNKAFPEDFMDAEGIFLYYMRIKNTHIEWGCNDFTDLPIQSVKDFLKPELKEGDLVWVSDESEEQAVSEKDEYIYLGMFKGQHILMFSNGYNGGDKERFESFKNGEFQEILSFEYVVKVPEKKEIELTLDEIAEKFKVDVDKLKIKK